MKNRLVIAATLLSVAFGASACTRVQANAAFKDGNKAYKEEKFKEAIEHYSRAVEHNPQMSEAWFYLGSSQQAMFRPGRETEENAAFLTDAITAYKKSLETNEGQSERDETVRDNALGALISIYTEPPHQDFGTALGYAEQLVKADPNDQVNLFAMANLYEKFEHFEEAEETYRRAVDLNPSDVKACGALAGFLNKPLWEGKSKFDEAVEVLERCAELAPEDPTGFYKVSTFYWDKAYRDPFITDEQKADYADKGLMAVDRALEIKPDYVDALVYKGLLFRVKAQVTRDARTRFQLLEQAQALQKQALDLKKAMEMEAAVEEEEGGEA